MVARPSCNDDDPTVARLQRAGAPEVAASWTTVTADVPRSDPAWWAYPDAWLDGDHPIPVGTRTIDAISTPGHTQGHYVFADRAAGLLFAGDHVLPTITPSIGFEPAYADQPLGDFLASLAKVRAMPDLRLLPAHGAVTSSTHARIDELVAHHDERLGSAWSRCGAAGARRTTSPTTCPGPGTPTPDELDVFNTALATMETLAHLQLLAAQGRVTRTESAGVLHYDA